MENFEVVQHMLEILGIERRDVSDTEYSKLKSSVEKHVAKVEKMALESCEELFPCEMFKSPCPEYYDSASWCRSCSTREKIRQLKEKFQ
jgi:hypothetical protein